MAKWRWNDVGDDRSWPYSDKEDVVVDDVDELIEKIVESGDAENADIYPSDLFE